MYSIPPLNFYMELFLLFSILITITAVFSYINIRTVKLPSAIALMLMGTFAAITVIIVGGVSPSFSQHIKEGVLLIDFSEFLLGILLSFLLFAGSLHVHLPDLKSQAKAVFGFATLGTLISTFVMGMALYWLLPYVDLAVPLIYCLIFGALISPTDPIAVMSILGKSNLPKSIQTTITGESLFNDGIGVVIFATLLQVSVRGIDNVSGMDITLLFIREAIGGLVIGFVIGFIGYRMMKQIDHFQTEILISLAIVMGGYSLCHFLHVSGPLAMVVAGMLTGNIGRRKAMSDQTRDYLEKFWQVIDESLNAILFLLMGLEIVTISVQLNYLIVGIASAILLLGVRYLSLLIPSFVFFLRKDIDGKALNIMTWGGLRGGISLALVLSLPQSEYKSVLVSITFVIVLFSVLAQGLTIEQFIKKYRS
jgi:monovalent cation:H+ antiporter, CPA1 family